MEYLFWIIVFIYSFYVAAESLSIFARYGGFVSKSMSVGLSLQNQILSLNRLLGFLIAPFVGFYADSGGTAQEIFFIGLAGSAFGGFLLIFLYRWWGSLGAFFSNIAISFVREGYNLNALILGATSKKRQIRPVHGKLKFNYFFAQLLTTGLAMPAIFVLNFIAVNYPVYASTLVQMGAVVSGVGNLILNFYTIPLLSVEESRDSENIEEIYRSIYLGKIFGMLLICPLFMVICYGI
jgi:hypothetical protein